MRGLALATAAASLFALAPLVASAGSGATATGFYYGVNACKGKGFVDGVTADTCVQLGGQFKTEDPMKKK